MVIGIDVLKAQVFEMQELRSFVNNFDKFYLTDARNVIGDEPPSFDYEELVEKLHKGSFKSVTKEVAHHLLERNIEKSQKHPGKFYFSRDRRMMFNEGIYLPQDAQIVLAKRLTMPYLFIKASNSFFLPGDKAQYDNEVLQILKSHKNFEHHVIDSTSHHLHLSEVEKVAGIMSDFIKKHKIIKSHV